MSALWTYFWPIFAAGLVIGAIARTVAFRRPSKRSAVLGCGVLAAIAAAALWHGPLGGANQFTDRVERGARQALDYYEMTQVTARLQRGPLSRRLILTGKADDFQHSELVRVLDQLPGVSSVSWSANRSGFPLIAEAALIAIAGFLFGMLLAYLVELHRRYNAQWKW
ncbi:MAG TPA: hypothetical protein VKC17_08955 [Sphingomicrobium sp.]|nr:hypothetical protein [Sphingomicrobium sp.]